MTSGAYAFMTLLLWIRERYVPSLKVEDDYQIFKKVEEWSKETEWLEPLRSIADEAFLEPIYLNLLSVLSEEISWGAIRTSFDDMEKNWERMLDYVKTLEDQEVYPIETFQEHFDVPSDMDIDQISVYALFLSSFEHRILQDHGIHSIGQLLNQTDEELQHIREIGLFPETLRHIKEQLHFFFSRLGEIPDDIVRGYTLRQSEPS